MRRQGIIISLVGAFLAALPFVVPDYWVGLLTQALIFGGFAMGLDILVGFTGMPTLGHASFFGLAGYGTALSMTRLGIDPWAAAGLGIGLSLAIALLFAPLAVRVRGLAFLTVTLAFGQVTWGLATRWTSFTGGENGIPGVQRPAFVWDLDTPIGFYYLTLVVVFALTVVLTRFVFSAMGMSLQGLRDSDTRMAALGYNVQARRAIAFIIAAFVGAIYGVLSTFFNKFLGPGSLDWRLSAQMLLSVVVGGTGSLWGPFVAGAGLHVLKTQLVGETQRWPMVLGGLYIITVVFLPDGLASIPLRIRKVLSAAASDERRELNNGAD